MKPSPKQLEALDLIAAGKFYPDLVKEEDGWHARWRAVSVENDWLDEYVREAAMTRLSEDAEEQRHETLHDAWMMALKSRTGLVVWNEADCLAFAAELREWSGSADEDVEARRRIVFSLHTSTDGTASFSLSCSQIGAAPGSRLAGRRNLRALGQAIYVFPPLRGMKGLSVALSQAEAESFLRSGARDLRDAGYTVEGADRTAEVTAEADLDSGETPPARGEKKPAPAQVKLTVKVAGSPVTAEEIRFLLEQGSSLVFFRDRWIEVDRNILRQALRALEKRDQSLRSPLGFALGIGRIGNLEMASVRVHGWLRGLISSLGAAKTGEALTPVTRPEGLVGELRDYQARGVAWLRFLTDNGFGALLADDMGLGKTIQTISWILSGGRGRKTLIVAPLTLLSNWRHELAKFAPSLSVYVHQGDGRHLASGFHRVVAEADVVVTSYNLLVRDYTAFGETAWEALVLDEAQVIKNPDTQAARAVCALRPPRRIALTGTPVENSVADLWSIEEFLNPGFLGDRKTFEEDYVKPLALDERSSAGGRLRHALEPFVLRRLKSDPAIAAELGPKREIKEYCSLSSAQRRDYEEALEDFRISDRQQGDVFALITRLKLVCDGEGKFERLCELMEQIFASGESCLVFTQYARIGEWLQKELAGRFGRKYPFLHGGLSVRAREEQIRLFNSGARTGCAFILSLRAGGFGLNLTKATHVIHFDRWWNPAVENQATDRAHRIGQTRTVFVHQFITSGTLEEHVDEILERKSRVAGTLVQSGESLLAQLSANEFAAAVQLDIVPEARAPRVQFGH